MNVIRPSDRSPTASVAPPPNSPEAAQSFGFIRRLLFLYVLAAGGVLASLLSPQPVFLAARTSGITGIVAGALLIALAGLLGSWPLARARLKRPTTRRAVPRWLRLPRLATDPLPAFRWRRAGRRASWCRWQPLP